MSLSGFGSEIKTTSLNLSKTTSLNLTKYSNLKTAKFGLGWKVGVNKNFDLDASALLLDEHDLIAENGDGSKYVVFYNQLDTHMGVRSLGDNLVGGTDDDDGDDETILVDLKKVPAVVKSILLIITIHEAEERQENFGMVRDAYIRIVDNDTDEELAKYNLTEEFALNTAVEVGKLERTDAGWVFKGIAKGYDEDLNKMLLRHGCR